MKRVLLLAVAFLLTLGLQAETINLGEFGRLSFTLDPSWKIASADMNDGTFEVMISPKGAVNAFGGFTLSTRLTTGTTTKERLEGALIADSREEAAGSVEQRTVPKEFTVKNGYGVTAQFTDRALVGKPPKKGDCKVQTKVMLVLAEMISISGACASDGFTDPAHLQLLAMFQSMEVLPREPAKN